MTRIINNKLFTFVCGDRNETINYISERSKLVQRKKKLSVVDL